MALALLKTVSQPGRLYFLPGVADLLVTASGEVVTAAAQLAMRARRLQARMRGVPVWVLDALAVQDTMAPDPRRVPDVGAGSLRRPEIRDPAVWAVRGRGSVDVVSPLW